MFCVCFPVESLGQVLSINWDTYLREEVCVNVVCKKYIVNGVHFCESF